MNTKEKLHNSINFNDLTVQYKAITTNISFNYFTELATL